MYKNQQHVVNIYMDDDIFDDNQVDELVEQLKESNHALKQQQKERETVTDDNLDEFIMKTSGDLIQDSLEVLNNVKEYTASSPDARECQSIAELIKAAATAIDTLNKVSLQNKKSKTQLQIKQLDIETKKGIATQEQQTKLLLSREDIMDKLFEDAEAIDITEDQ